MALAQRIAATAVVLTVLGCAAWTLAPRQGDGIHGHARVIDGDTIVVDGKHVRLFGIDAPELHQRCGPEACGLAAKAALERMTRNDPVSCTEQDRDRYGRSVAICRTVDGDLGARLVALGMAVDYRTYSHGRYADQQDAARAEGLGIWRTGFTWPAEYRRMSKP